MTQTLSPTPSRRRVLAWVALATLTATAARASDGEEIDPTDTVPRWFSVRAFTDLDADDIYMVNLAIRGGRTILIEGYTPSESRQIIRDAAQDWPGTRARLLQGR